jgi:hypothetical protein
MYDDFETYNASIFIDGMANAAGQDRLGSGCDSCIALHCIASHRIASHRIASHCIASHRIASHRVFSIRG